MRLEAPSADCRDSDAAVAVWPDGHRKAILSITVGDMKAKASGRQGATSRSEGFVMEHEETHHRLVVRRRVDRDLLMSLFEQQKQATILTAIHSPTPSTPPPPAPRPPPVRAYPVRLVLPGLMGGGPTTEAR